MSNGATETMSDSLESDEEFDLGHKISDLKERSRHPKFENVGYIRWVGDKIDDSDEIVLQVDYPNENKHFKEVINFPKDLKIDSKLKRLIEHPDLPFSEGSFTNEELQDEPVPIDIEREVVIVPETESWLPDEIENGVEHIRERGILVSIISGLAFGLTILSLLLVSISIIMVFLL
jgi:hypothetical protein